MGVKEFLLCHVVKVAMKKEGSLVLAWIVLCKVNMGCINPVNPLAALSLASFASIASSSKA